MLFLLTGDVQIGKTRWLEGLVGQIEEAGVPVAGVLAPGVWREQGSGGFEKLGIDNLLLPERHESHLAVRPFPDSPARLGARGMVALRLAIE